MRVFTKVSVLMTLALAGLYEIESQACTNVLVTKGASADGSNMISYAADSHQLFGELYFAPAGTWSADAMRKINEWLYIVTMANIVAAWL